MFPFSNVLYILIIMLQLNMSHGAKKYVNCVRLHINIIVALVMETKAIKKYIYNYTNNIYIYIHIYIYIYTVYIYIYYIYLLLFSMSKVAYPGT